MGHRAVELPDSKTSTLIPLASRLAAKREEIMKSWEGRVRQRVPAASQQSVQALRDHVPRFLVSMSQTLIDWSWGLHESKAKREAGQEHGQQRAGLAGYSLDQVLDEYSLLQETIFEALERDAALLIPERDAILHCIDVARAEATTEFVERFQELLDRQGQLTESERSFRELAEVMPQIIWTLEPDGVLSYVNDRWTEYTGMPKSDFNSAMIPAEASSIQGGWEASFQSERPFEFEYRLRSPNGEFRWYLGNTVPVRGATGKITKWIGTAVDTDEHKKHVSRLHQERQLREQFVATLSHDLRSPLQAARTNAEMMVRFSEKAEARERCSGRVLFNLDRIEKMIGDLLDANRIRAGEVMPIQLESCDLRTLVRETVEEQGFIHGDRILLEAFGPVVGDFEPNGIKRILENLISNALKYGDSSTKVVVGVRMQQQGAVLSVHNEGNPIPVEDRENLFQQFHRSRAASVSGKQGWGLGLTLVKGLVEAHQGKVEIESDPSCGTTFRIQLPLRPPTSSSEKSGVC